MRPRIICHMLSSVDGRIDGASLESVTPSGEYETTGAELTGDAWICGRTTMQQHFADAGTFVPTSKKAAGLQPVYVARRAKSYAVSVNTTGKLICSSGDLDGDHLICAVTEQAPEGYMQMLRDRSISYIVSGSTVVDLVRAVELLGEHFGIRTLLLEGGGHINCGFLEAGLVDELSLLIVPGIDGRHGIPSVFDGLGASRKRAVSLSR